jgi:hypothetical protein
MMAAQTAEPFRLGSVMTHELNILLRKKNKGAYSII